MLKNYLSQLHQITQQGDAREESYYSALELLLRQYTDINKKQKAHITTIPKRTDAGNPDFRIWDGLTHIIGYVEAKAPGTNLDAVENGEQLERYRKTFPNLILTNFYEFRLYRNGEIIDSVMIGRQFISNKLGLVPVVENEEKFFTLLWKFFDFILPKVFTAESLAVELAKRTRFLKDDVITIELEEEKVKRGKISGFYDAFRQYLIADLTEDDFADIYSQTLTYGMFAARTRSSNSFNRKLAYSLIPQSIGILRDIFQFISLGNLPKQMEVIIDDIAEVLNAADVNKILHSYHKTGKGDDPIVHFYETFLNIYDPSTREKRGVYYTPEPIVKYIVRSVHEFLITHFGKPDGLASDGVTLLDPAAGTLTFPAEAIKLAVKEFTNKFGEGGLSNFIRNKILNNFYAFELMMAPYAIGHIKISLLLEEFGYKMSDEERFKLYLTNTLDMEELEQTQIPGLESLSSESHNAGKIKKKEPILVIMGNPPYSYHSANTSKWTEKLLKEDINGAINYYSLDGMPLGEKNPKGLQDDYVKFIRFAQWKIQLAGRGIVGLITNHGYLENPTFRGMRQSLMKTFNEIYIIDLHGNSLKKETAPDGSKDENVFDIRQGTSIAIFVKQENKNGCKVYVNDLYGLRQRKYNWLEKAKYSKKHYVYIEPTKPFYLFKQDNTKEIKHYLKWLNVQEIFPVNSVGIVSSRDDFAVDFDRENLKRKIRQFSDLKIADELISTAYNLKDTGTWKFREARESVAADNEWEDKIMPILYRPFDTRYIFYSDDVVERTRRNVMQNMMKDNLGLITSRIIKGGKYEHTFISKFITNGALLASNTSSSSYIFPLYIYSTSEKNKDKKQRSKENGSDKGGSTGKQTSRGSYYALNYGSTTMFEPEVKYEVLEKVPNINSYLMEQLSVIFKRKPTPEEILNYIYAVLYSNKYRDKYAEFLKGDFPRIPFTSNYELFKKIAALGESLIGLHLMDSKLLHKPVSKFKGGGDNQKIEKIYYNGEQKRIYINNDKYFTNIDPKLWNYFIGGYCVIQKYLKDRKDRIISDPEHFCRIITALYYTIELQNQIDEVYNNIEDHILEIEHKS